MKTLTNKQLVRLANWNHMTAATAYVLEGEELERARRMGHDEAFCIYAGAALSDSKHHYERQKAEVATAVTIEDGEIVEMAGRKFTVTVMRGCHDHPKFSDPIKLMPVA
jgi:hypothetical protein